MRHRIFAAFGSTGTSHDVFNFGKSSQEASSTRWFTPIDFVQRGFGRKNRLNQEGSFVELRHEVRTDEERKD